LKIKLAPQALHLRRFLTNSRLAAKEKEKQCRGVSGRVSEPTKSVGGAGARSAVGSRMGERGWRAGGGREVRKTYLPFTATAGPLPRSTVI
jgi:hypothetical protein